MDIKQIQELSKLCKIQVSKEEAEGLLKDIEAIVQYVEQLKEVDTTNVEPCYQVVSYQENVFADDEIDDTLDPREYLKNTPAHVGSLIRTPPVIKF